MHQVEMEWRKCLTCKKPLKVMVGSSQKFCHELCQRVGMRWSLSQNPPLKDGAACKENVTLEISKTRNFVKSTLPGVKGIAKKTTMTYAEKIDKGIKGIGLIETPVGMYGRRKTKNEF